MSNPSVVDVFDTRANGILLRYVTFRDRQETSRNLKPLPSILLPPGEYGGINTAAICTCIY